MTMIRNDVTSAWMDLRDDCSGSVEGEKKAKLLYTRDHGGGHLTIHADRVQVTVRLQDITEMVRKEMEAVNGGADNSEVRCFQKAVFEAR